MAISGVNPFAEDLLDSFVSPDSINFPFYPGLYAFFNGAGTPIYIGQSKNVPQRLKEHRRKPWYKFVESSRVLTFADESERLCAEAVLQLRHRPRFCRAIKLGLANDGTLRELQFLRSR
jgi:excinuclease UvrABC nuclease subunit